jgi:hypothetical protein
MKNARPKNVNESYERLIREIQDEMGKGKAWGTRVLKGHDTQLNTLINFLKIDQNWEKRACPRATRKRWRHELFMYAPVVPLSKALRRLSRDDYGSSWSNSAHSHYYKMVMTDFEKSIVSAFRNEEFEQENLTEYQIGRCAIAKLSCQE